MGCRDEIRFRVCAHHICSAFALGFAGVTQACFYGMPPEDTFNCAYASVQKRGRQGARGENGGGWDCRERKTGAHPISTPAMLTTALIPPTLSMHSLCIQLSLAPASFCLACRKPQHLQVNLQRTPIGKPCRVSVGTGLDGPVV